jgi:hypothetical protein
MKFACKVISQVVMEQDSGNFQLRLVRRPLWSGRWPVANKPRCGFQGNAAECQSNQKQPKVSIGKIQKLFFLQALQTKSSEVYGAAFGTALVLIFLISATFYVRYFSRLKVLAEELVHCNPSFNRIQT